MASPRLRVSPLTPTTGRSPGSRVLEASTPANGRSFSKDEAIWKRLKEAGFDEEMIKRRDKAALIAYITKLESEVYDYQYNMGLLIIEKDEWKSKYEQAKASANLAEVIFKRDKAAHASALAEARKQEDGLKRALAIEKECVRNIEKALHDVRAECVEIKLVHESKQAEARETLETAHKKFEEAQSKQHSAESLHAEASRCRDIALRNLQDVESREDELRRRLVAFQSECDAKEKELSIQRQSLHDSQRILHQEQEKLSERQSLLNEREDYIYERSKELSRFEKELTEAKAKYEEECTMVKEKRSNLDLDMTALANREEAVIKRESHLDRRERELLILQEKILSKEYDEVQRLAAEHEFALEKSKHEFEAEIEERRKLFEGEMEARKTVYDDKNSELIQRENLIKEKEKCIDVRLKVLSGNQVDLVSRLKLLEEKEQSIQSIEKEAEMVMLHAQKEREDLKKTQEELEKIKCSLEDQKIKFLHEQHKLDLSIHEKNELLNLEIKLKEEIDGFRSKKMELDVETDKLRAEKEKFETQWDLIEEKREELRKEGESVAEERKAICTYLKNEHDSIKFEKDNLRDQFKMEAESLAREREEFMGKMEREHSEWVIKIQREREDFIKDVNIQRKELENRIEIRKEEIETNLREKEEAFEQERVKELQHINSQKEMIAKQLEHVTSELKRVDNERAEIALDREQREKEWAEIKSSIDMLNMQREKLQNQRELLHADREEIYQKTQQLRRLEQLDIESENRDLLEQNSQELQKTKSKFTIRKCVNTSAGAQSIDYQKEQKFIAEEPLNVGSPPLSAAVSLVKKYARAIFKLSPEKVYTSSERIMESKMYDLQDTDVIPSMSSLDITAERLPEIEHKHGSEEVTTQTKEDGDNGVVKKSCSSTVNEKRRPNDLFSNDHIELEPKQKQRKKARQNGSDAMKEKSPTCEIHKMQVQETGSAILEAGEPENKIDALMVMMKLKEGNGYN